MCVRGAGVCAVRFGPVTAPEGGGTRGGMVMAVRLAAPPGGGLYALGGYEDGQCAHTHADMHVCDGICIHMHSQHIGL